MATNVAVDEKFLRVESRSTKEAAVTDALEEYVRRRKQLAVLDLFGKVEIDSHYDLMKQRRRK
jgi:hypothetical protein